MNHRTISVKVKFLGQTSAVAIILTGAAMLSAGCQQMATYPPVETTARLQRPAAEPVPTIIAETVRYARDHFVDGQVLPINLPEDVPHTVYEKVFAHLEGGRPMHVPGEKALHITEIRTRSMNAQVDMIFPTANGFYEFVTVTLERSVLRSWHVTSQRKWVMRNVTPPSPHYLPPPPPDAEPVEATAKVTGW